MNENNIFAHYPDCIGDRHKLRGVLLDFFPGERLQPNLIMAAFDAGIVAMIKRATRLDEDLQMKVWRMLVEDFGVSKSNAGWAVEYWMNNYGSFVLRKPFDFVEFPTDSLKNNGSEATTANEEIMAAKAETETVKAELKSVRAETDSLKAELEKTLADLEKAKADLQSAKAELETIRQAEMPTSNSGVQEPPAKKQSVEHTKKAASVTKPQAKIEGSIAISAMEEDEKLPKERVVLFPDEYAKLGITNFRASVIRGYEFDGYVMLSVNGEYDGKTSNHLIIMPMVFNENNELIAAEFDEEIKAKIRSHKTYSTRFRTPNHEKISRVEVRIIKDPVFLD